MSDNLSSTSIYGRKIFFLSATFTLNTNIIMRLMAQEYEVYKIDQFRQVKSLLKVNPDAIVIVNVDYGNPVSYWFNFIKYFESEPAYKNTSWGVISTRLEKAESDKFNNELRHTAGFYPNVKDYTQLMRDLITKLEELQAKGRRQFVRTNCSGNKDSLAFLVTSNCMFKMRLLDISSIGCGILLGKNNTTLVKVNSFIHGLTLVLNHKHLTCNAKVFALKPFKDGIVAVLIFTPDTPDKFRNAVRAFICDESHKNLMSTVLSLAWDKTDYSTPVGSGNVKEVGTSEDEVKTEEGEAPEQQNETQENNGAEEASPSSQIFGEEVYKGEEPSEKPAESQIIEAPEENEEATEAEEIEPAEN